MADKDDLATLLREIRDDQRAMLALLRQSREERLRGSGARRLLRGLLWVTVPVALLLLLLKLWPYARYMLG